MVEYGAVIQGELVHVVVRILGLFYVDDGILVSWGPKWLQGALNILIILFSRIGLGDNVSKSNTIYFNPGESVPKIQDMLLKIDGFTHASYFDLNMGYYHIESPTGEKQICDIIPQWGKYEYQELPMRGCNSHDILQKHISKLFEGFDMLNTYIYDLTMITKNDFKDHLKAL